MVEKKTSKLGNLSLIFIKSLSFNGLYWSDPSHRPQSYPTCLDVAGLTYPTKFDGRPVIPSPGKSLLPCFYGESAPRHETLYWEHEGNRAIREGKWKLVSQLGKNWELYEIERDPCEERDLAYDNPETIRRLAARWQVWADSVGVVPWSVTGKSPRVPNYHPEAK